MFLSQYSKSPGPILQRLQSLNGGCLYILAQTSGAFRRHGNISVWLSLQSQVIKKSRNKPVSNPRAEWCEGKREGEERGRGMRWNWEKEASRSSPDPKPSLGLMEKAGIYSRLPHNTRRPLPPPGLRRRLCMCLCIKRNPSP